MQSYFRQYTSVMDDRDTTRGMNNYAAPVQVLAASQKNESKEWKSQLTVESVMEMTEIKALFREKDFQEDFSGLGSDSTDCDRSHPTQEPPTPGVSVQRSPPSPYGVFSRTRPAGSQFSYTQPTNPTPSSHNAGAALRHRQRGVTQPPLRKEATRPAVSGCGQSQGWSTRFGGDEGSKGFRKRARVEPEVMEDGEEEETESRQQTPFITARDQYVINQRKKFGRGAGEYSGGGGRGGRQVSSGSYGVSKKSLGTRRAAGGKFVPPVKRDQEDDINEEIRSRVLYGSNKGSGNGAESSKGLPPELEGDERLKNIEPRMVELIMNEIMDHGSPVLWDDIAGLEFAKATIKEIVVWPMLRPDIFTGLRGPPKGILLFGPPGTGKTLIGKCIASQVNATFFSISASSLTSKWVGEGEKMVRALFAVSRCYQPAVIFIDEIDSLLSQRSDSEHESSRRIKTEFLVQLDGATTSADDRLLVIGATNRPQEIDEAARRRLVKRLYIPLPDAPARKQIVLNLMKQQPFLLSEDEIENICLKSEGYSGADMANLCREAAYGPVREAAGSIQHISAEDMRPILYKDFEAALRIIKPSVSDRDLELYVDWNRQFGCGLNSHVD